MISFAAITPHTPLLIPNVAKEKGEKIKITKEAMDDLREKLEKSGIDTLILVSEHKKMHHDTFGILLSDKYQVQFKDFGDFETKLEYFPDLELIEKIRHTAIDNEVPFSLIHEDNLEYTFGVPLFCLVGKKPIKIVPFLYNYTDIKDQFELGRMIKKILAESNKKIGILASGHLSHKSTEDGPSGFSKQGEEFNIKLRELLETKNTAGILSLDKKFTSEADESIMPPLSILMGIIDRINYKPQTFSFEAPLGTGYLVFNFKLL
ncbi:MAG: class III extradiol dioxygenase subunit B-like domain-containing protein [Patescibacteria group bacterium]